LQDLEGNTPLHLASTYGHEKVIRILAKEASKSLEIKNIFG